MAVPVPAALARVALATAVPEAQGRPALAAGALQQVTAQVARGSLEARAMGAPAAALEVVRRKAAALAAT